MNPVILIAVPLALLILGMILNAFGPGSEYPESSTESDPTKRLAAEKEAYRKLSDLQRERFLKRQKRVCQYAWLVLVASAVSFGWLYFDTLTKTTASKQIAAIHTASASEGKEVILSITLSDGNIAKYLVKPAKAETTETTGGAPKNGLSKEPITSWELSRLETILSTGKNALPLGIALTIPN